jgi:hypothetical protein
MLVKIKESGKIKDLSDGVAKRLINRKLAEKAEPKAKAEPKKATK